MSNFIVLLTEPFFFLQCAIMEDVPRASPGFSAPLSHGPGAGSASQDHAALWTNQHRNNSFLGPPAGGGRAPPWGGTADTWPGIAGWQLRGAQLLWMVTDLISTEHKLNAASWCITGLWQSGLHWFTLSLSVSVSGAVVDNFTIFFRHFRFPLLHTLCVLRLVDCKLHNFIADLHNSLEWTDNALTGSSVIRRLNTCNYISVFEKEGIMLQPLGI